MTWEVQDLKSSVPGTGWPRATTLPSASAPLLWAAPFCGSSRALALVPLRSFHTSILSAPGALSGRPQQTPGRGGQPPRPLPTRCRISRSLALSSLNKHTEAVAYYKKALELDPDNETYKSNLKIAELKLRETPSPVSSPRKGAGGSREV